jgi:hypothetical protein
MGCLTETETMRPNGDAGVSRGTAPRLRNGIRLQADMRPARAALIDALVLCFCSHDFNCTYFDGAALGVVQGARSATGDAPNAARAEMR